MRVLSVALFIAIVAPGTSNASDPKRERDSIRGYAAVPVYYGWNKMLLDAAVNGKKARFAIDTGASFSVFDEDRARAFGVKPVDADSAYGEFTMINHQAHRVGYIQNLRAGAMDFGGGPIVLFSRSQLGGRSRLPGPEIDGIIGADILTRYKAVINCLTKTAYFRIDPGAHLQMAHFAASQHFTRVPLREEVSRGFTVPAKVNGHSCRLLVDTGGSNTVFNQDKARQFGLALEKTRMAVSFTDGISRRVSLGEVNNLMIGDFHAPPQKLATVALPDFAVEHGGNVQIDGIIGMEMLALNRGIIDFDSMSLFLK
jgi:predicted aspartyl protease